MKKISFICCLMLLLTACATPYQQAGLMGGYSNLALSQDTYQVSFRGNGYSSAQHVSTYLLRRCAEITLEKGYKYFIIEAGNISANQSAWTTPTNIQTNSYTNYSTNGNTYNNPTGYNYYSSNSIINQNSYTNINPSQTYTMNRFTAIAVIKLLATNEEHPSAFDATIILSNFKNNQ